MAKQYAHKKFPDGSEYILARCKIYGRYKGEDWSWEDPEDESEWSYYIHEATEYWWMDGNGSCDCNRVRFMPPHLQQKHNGKHKNKCGYDIDLYKIVPFDEELPVLEFDETNY